MAISLFVHCFKIGQTPYFIGMGIKEIIYDHQEDGKVASLAKQFFNYETLHGALLIGCGAAEAVLSIERLGFTALSLSTAFAVAALSNGCFLIANIFMVCEQIRLLASLKEEGDEKKAREVKIGALISLFSGVCYVVGMAFLLFGAPAALIVLLMLLGLCGGGLRILYDLLLYSKIITI